MSSFKLTRTNGAILAAMNALVRHCSLGSFMIQMDASAPLRRNPSSRDYTAAGYTDTGKRVSFDMWLTWQDGRDPNLIEARGVFAHYAAHNPVYKHVVCRYTKDGGIRVWLFGREAGFSNCLSRGVPFAEHELVHGPQVIQQQVANGDYTGYCSPTIHDGIYPTVGEGRTSVKYGIVPGKDAVRGPLGLVKRQDVISSLVFQGKKMRFANAAEALLFGARHPDVGQAGYKLVAFLDNRAEAFVFNKNARGRCLTDPSTPEFDASVYSFLVVYID